MNAKLEQLSGEGGSMCSLLVLCTCENEQHGLQILPSPTCKAGAVLFAGHDRPYAACAEEYC
jgi:hypothetical protein